MFGKAVPSESTISSWSKKVDCSPGFTQPALDLIKSIVLEQHKTGRKIYLALIFDDIHIRKHFTLHQGSLIGGSDFGDGPMEGEDEAAGMVMTIMVVAYNMSLKLPVGYFEFNKIKLSVRANLISLAIDKINETGAVLLSLTCDNTNENIGTYTELGANCKTPGSFKSTITKTNSLNYPIHIFLDNPHCIKLGILFMCNLIFYRNFSISFYLKGQLIFLFINSSFYL